jgi:hypothetical protein
VAFGADWELQDELKALGQGSSQERGRALERLVAGILRDLQFEVRLNPRAARPRQTDLIATKGEDRYLIECKNLSRKADVDDVDSLRSRLGRTHGAFGLLVSMAGFSSTAISEVSIRRDQPILLLSGDELRHLGHWPAGLLDLLWTKRQALLLDGQVLVDEPARRRKVRRPPLPGSLARFTIHDEEPTSMFVSGGGFGMLTFAQHLEDIDWVSASGNGVALDISVPVRSERDFVEVMSTLADLGWATTEACWSIQQARTVWHGFGAAAFMQEMPRWKARAETQQAHHSEEFCYVDNCPGGFYTLTSKLTAEKWRLAERTTLSFQLQGIPLDLGPLRQLCRALGVHDNVYFRPREEKSIVRVEFPQWMRDIQTPRALVTTVDDIDQRTWVSGLVAPNPLRDPRWRADPGPHDSHLRELEDFEYLVYRLPEFHYAGDGRAYTYTLRDIERARTSEGSIFLLNARWDYADDTDEQPCSILSPTTLATDSRCSVDDA